METLASWDSSCKDLNNQKTSGLIKKLDYVIYVEDVSAQPLLSPTEKYLRYVISQGVYIEGSQLRTAPIITPIL